MGGTKQSKTRIQECSTLNRYGIHDGFGAPVTGLTLRAQVGKRSETHLVKVSSSIIIHEERNEGTVRRQSQRGRIVGTFVEKHRSAAASCGDKRVSGKRRFRGLSCKDYGINPSDGD